MAPPEPWRQTPERITAGWNLLSFHPAHRGIGAQR